MGVEFELAGTFDDLQWVGLGPWENYPDRRASALLGRWTSTIDDAAVPYVLPQENGGRGDVRSVRLTGPAGVVTTTHDSPMQLTVTRHTVQELEAAQALVGAAGESPNHCAARHRAPRHRHSPTGT